MKLLQKVFIWGNISLLVFILIINNSQANIEKISENITSENEIDDLITRKHPKISHTTKTCHDPIIIERNSDFVNQAASEGWSGYGTENSPYLIQNYIINTDGVSGLQISNTDIYFIVRNVYVSGATSSLEEGFYFSNVKNGIIEDNTAEGNYVGFDIRNSQKLSISGNVAVNNNVFGFFIASDFRNVFSNNTAINNGNDGFGIVSSEKNIFNSNSANGNNIGFHLNDAHNNTLQNNIATENTKWGFSLSHSINNTLIGNSSMDNIYSGFEINNQCYFNIFNGNIATNNSHEGFELRFNCKFNTYSNNIAENNDNGFELNYKNDNNMFINNSAIDNNYSGYKVTTSANTIFKENFAMNNNLHGFELRDLNNSFIIKNRATNNSLSGFYLTGSFNNTITHNTLTNNNLYGFSLNYYDNYNRIIYNTITNNTLFGLCISNSLPENNSFFLNIFIDNNNGSTQAFSNGHNFWNNGTHGNYWNDYVWIDNNSDSLGDNPYYIDGDSQESDTYPLIAPIEYDIPDIPDIYELGLSNNNSSDHTSGSFSVIQLLIGTALLAIFIRIKKTSY